MTASRSKATALVALQFAFLALLLLNPFQPLREIERIITLTLYAIATVILASAAVALGSALTASPIPKDDAELVMTGIYKWIRHPMYTALILIGLGLLLGTFNIFSLVIYTTLVMVLLYKSRYEDALLRERHRRAREYQESTGRFFPKF